MKISRLEIENFAIEESPTINEQSVEGRDLLLSGGNRSGKTLIFNALLYGLFGRSGTFGISPGQRSKINIHFDNAHIISRERSHQYEHEDGILGANEGVEKYVGPRKTIQLQFIASNPTNQPLSILSGQELLNRLRTILTNERQSEIERHRRAQSELEHRREIRRRGEDRPSIREIEEELDSLPVQQTRDRIADIEELRELIKSGEVESISARLQQKDEIASRLDDLYDRRRELEDTLKSKRGELADASRYTQEVSELIVDAIHEFTCPVCGRLVEESTARQRLPDRCPQCGRPRDLSELRENLRQKVDNADSRVDELKEDIADLEEELASVNAEINELTESEPELSGLNQFVRTALKQADYEIDSLQERTSEELQNHRENLEELESQQQTLNQQLKERRELLAELDNAIEESKYEIEQLEGDAFDEIREEFTSRLSMIYHDIAPDLGTEIGFTPEGELEFPGTGSEGARSYDRLSSGERRLVNLAFAITLAEFAQENEDAHEWEVIVLDEPLTNLESEIQDAAARYLRETDIQCIMTSPLDRIQSHFQDDQAEIIPLDRIRTENTTLEEYL
jgi:DNA repair exonuclease SbcCD ATPase subunit